MSRRCRPSILSSMTNTPLIQTTFNRIIAPGVNDGSSIHPPGLKGADDRGHANGAANRLAPTSLAGLPPAGPLVVGSAERSLHDDAGLPETAARAGGPRARPRTNESTLSGSSPTARANRSAPSRLCGHVTSPADPRDTTPAEAAQDSRRPWRVCRPAARDSARARAPPRRSTKSFGAASTMRSSSPASLERGIRPREECGTRMRYRPGNWGRMPANR